MIRALLILMAVLGGSSPALAQAGASEEALVTYGNASIRALVYRPACPTPSLLIAFHGLRRNIESTRAAAKPFADRHCMVLIVPLFEDDRFPGWSYQRGGLVRRRALLPPNDWTVHWVGRIAGWAERREGRAMPLTLFGHSAGAQFLSRVMAYSGIRVSRAVIANPSTHVMASAEQVPFGFGGFPNGEAALRAYLASPIVIALGEEDTGDQDLADSPEARAQGANRLERGRNAYATAVAAAQTRGIRLGWRLAIVPGAGHSARSMYNSAEVAHALGP